MKTETRRDTPRARFRNVTLGALVLGAGLACAAPADDAMHLEYVTPAFAAIVDRDAGIEVLATGYTWSEGPVWIDDDGGYLLFSDVPENTMYRWRESAGADVFLQPSGYDGDHPEQFREPGSNGLARTRNAGHILVADHGNRAIVRLALDTRRKQVIADRYDGQRFNSPNDVVEAADGSLYFTDPPYGLAGQDESPVKELPVNGVYRVAPDGDVTLLDADLGRPNGVGLSPDGKTLYVANSDPERPVWMAYTLDDDGGVASRRLLFDGSELLAKYGYGLPDGMTVAADGTLLASGPGGILAIAPDGTLLGIVVTGESSANCTFGGADGKSLFITSGSRLLRVATRTQAAIQ